MPGYDDPKDMRESNEQELTAGGNTGEAVADTSAIPIVPYTTNQSLYAAAAASGGGSAAEDAKDLPTGVATSTIVINVNAIISGFINRLDILTFQDDECFALGIVRDNSNKENITTISDIGENIGYLKSAIKAFQSQKRNNKRMRQMLKETERCINKINEATTSHFCVLFPEMMVKGKDVDPAWQKQAHPNSEQDIKSIPAYVNDRFYDLRDMADVYQWALQHDQTHTACYKKYYLAAIKDWLGHYQQSPKADGLKKSFASMLLQLIDEHKDDLSQLNFNELYIAATALKGGDSSGPGGKLGTIIKILFRLIDPEHPPKGPHHYGFEVPKGYKYDPEIKKVVHLKDLFKIWHRHPGKTLKTIGKDDKPEWRGDFYRYSYILVERLSEFHYPLFMAAQIGEFEFLRKLQYDKGDLPPYYHRAMLEIRFSLSNNTIQNFKDYFPEEYEELKQLTSVEGYKKQSSSRFKALRQMWKACCLRPVALRDEQSPITRDLKEEAAKQNDVVQGELVDAAPAADIIVQGVAVPTPEKQESVDVNDLPVQVSVVDVHETTSELLTTLPNADSLKSHPYLGVIERDESIGNAVSASFATNKARLVAPSKNDASTEQSRKLATTDHLNSDEEHTVESLTARFNQLWSKNKNAVSARTVQVDSRATETESTNKTNPKLGLIAG